jgi:hypothetical protein
MKTSTMHSTPLAVYPFVKYTPDSMIVRVVYAVRLKTAYIIHGTNNSGLPCNEKKRLKF